MFAPGPLLLVSPEFATLWWMEEDSNNNQTRGFARKLKLEYFGFKSIILAARTTIALLLKGMIQI